MEIIASVEPEGRSFLSKGVVLCHGVTISVTEGHSAWRGVGVKSPICLELSELFSGFRNQVVPSVD